MVASAQTLTTDQKGAIAESAIVAEAVLLGVSVSRPIAPARYDLIFDLGHALHRVQCKWASLHGDVVIVRCRTSRRSRAGYVRTDYTREEVDAIAAYCLELDRCFYFPFASFPPQTAIQLRLSPARNNQRRLVNWADSFELDATLRLLGP
jgi:hypothetical protein